MTRILWLILMFVLLSIAFVIGAIVGAFERLNDYLIEANHGNERKPTMKLSKWHKAGTKSIIQNVKWKGVLK